MALTSFDPSRWDAKTLLEALQQQPELATPPLLLAEMLQGIFSNLEERYLALQAVSVDAETRSTRDRLAQSLSR